jgi:outer membrane cobalamin receptor
MSWLKRAAIMSVLAVLAAPARHARADGGADLEGLLNETIITTASKSAERGSTAPAISTILTAEDIRTYGIHSIDEAIDFLSLGAMTSNPLRSVDIGARGVLLPHDQGDHFLLLINGHAMNEALYGAARFDRGAGVPIEMVDHIEVILGPGSVLYGSNAMLGVINVVTKQAREFGGGHVVVESEIAKSYRASVGAGLQTTLGGAPAELAFQLDYYRQNGPAFTVGPQNFGYDWATGQPYSFSPGHATGIWGGTASHSYYSQVPAALLTFKLKNFEIDLHGSEFKRSTPFNNLFVNIDSDFDEKDNYELDRSAFVDIKHHAELSTVFQLSERLYADTFDYQRYVDVSAQSQCLFANVVTCRNRTLSESQWAGLEVQGSFDWWKDGRLVTLLGADGRIRHVQSITDVLDDGTMAYLQSTTSVLSKNDRIFGAYLQQTFTPNAWFGLNAGGRLDFDRRFGYHFSPRVATSFGVWRGGTLKGLYSEAFRAPSWQESAWSSDRQPVAQNLSPESVRSVEASLDQTFGSHRLVFGVFRSWWSDLVELHTLTTQELLAAEAAHQVGIQAQSGAQYRNVSSIDDYGFNAGYEGSFANGRLRYGVNVTGAMARRDAADSHPRPLVVAPHLFGNARLSYALGEGLPTLAAAARYLAKRPADRAFEGGFAPEPYAPPEFEWRATLLGPVPGVPGLSYRASFDYAFASRSAYVVGPIQSGTLTQNVLGGNTTQSAELGPVDRARATVGLRYDFGGAR